jgi:hypothetical protein
MECPAENMENKYLRILLLGYEENCLLVCNSI